MVNERFAEIATEKAKEFEPNENGTGAKSIHDVEYLDADVRANIDGSLKSVRALLQFGGPNIWLKSNGRSATVLVAQGSDHHEVPIFNDDFADEMWEHFALQWENAEPKA